MIPLSRREFLSVSAAAAAGLALAACQPIQAPTPEPTRLAPLPLVEPVEVNLLTADQEETIGKAVAYLMDAHRVPGLGLGIIRDGEVVYAKGFGVTRVGTEHPITTQSLFRTMGLTHSFTAAAAMQLVEQGKLDLDAPVVEYLPCFRLADERYSQITARHLMTETAGLPLTPEYRPSLDWEGKTRQTDDEALQRYVCSLEQVRLFADPGTMYALCNMGYDILGGVIAEVTGETFEDSVTQHILRPLGMASSTFYPEEVHPDLLVMPHIDKGGSALVSDLVTHSRERTPSVGLFSNVAELTRWMLANLNRGELDGVRFLQDTSSAQMWTPDFPLEANWYPDIAAAGLGWFVGSRGDRPVYKQWGEDVGFYCACHLFPEDKAGAIVLGNKTSPMTPENEGPFGYAETLAAMSLDIVRG